MLLSMKYQIASSAGEPLAIGRVLLVEPPEDVFRACQIDQSSPDRLSAQRQLKTMHASNTKEKPNEQDIKKIHAAPHVGAAANTLDSREMTAYQRSKSQQPLVPHLPDWLQVSFSGPTSITHYCKQANILKQAS